MGKVKISEVKSILSAARKARSSRLILPDRSDRSTRTANERGIAKLLTPALTKAGFDISKIEKLLKHDRGQLPKRPQPDAAKEYVWMNNNIVKSVKNRISAIEQLLTSSPPLYTPYAPSYDYIQPFLIWATPIGILEDSNIQPDDNWAKLRVDTTETTGGNDLNFYYLWNNPSDYSAVIDIETFVTFYGYCFVQSFGGFWPSKGHRLGPGPTTRRYSLPPVILDLLYREPGLSSQSVQIESLDVDSGGFLSSGGRSWL